MSCDNVSLWAEPDSKLDSLAWLIGEWESPQSEGVFTESWRKIRANVYEGVGTYQIEGDTVFMEKLRLQTVHGHIVYIATVGKQQPILFSLKKKVKNVWTFENSEHDFPQEIHYINIGENSFEAHVSGIRDEKVAVDKLSFQRKNRK